MMWISSKKKKKTPVIAVNDLKRKGKKAKRKKEGKISPRESPQKTPLHIRAIVNKLLLQGCIRSHEGRPTSFIY